jgi:hypothetical protein
MDARPKVYRCGRASSFDEDCTVMSLLPRTSDGATGKATGCGSARTYGGALQRASESLQFFADLGRAGVWVHDRRNRIQPNPKCLPASVIAAEEKLYAAVAEDGEQSEASNNAFVNVMSRNIDKGARRLF